ncbi:uncharacterized protein LOC135213132 isoform X7 [Macrobrachium nipponense]|uniref:uncharacterized protein LOC135213132 isoform X7 n=1 Tax=Macrobrachium nipponense TaxID=159736 RepID=UPI0030C854B3
MDDKRKKNTQKCPECNYWGTAADLRKHLTIHTDYHNRQNCSSLQFQVFATDDHRIDTVRVRAALYELSVKRNQNWKRQKRKRINITAMDESCSF